MLHVDNLGQFCADLDKWIDTCEDLAEGSLRGLAAQAFRYIVLASPEWSGNLAASWRLTVGSPATGYTPSYWKSLEFGGLSLNPEPYSRAAPNTQAIHYAMSIAASQLRFVRLGAPVYITNTAPYAADVENDIVGYRRTSRVRGANRPLEMTHATKDKFSAYGNISAAKALQLSQERL